MYEITIVPFYYAFTMYSISCMHTMKILCLDNTLSNPDDRI